MQVTRWPHPRDDGFEMENYKAPDSTNWPENQRGIFWGVLTFNPTCRGLFDPIFIAGYLACWWFQLHLKKIFSQIGSFLQVGVKIKHIWNHHPDWVSCICPPCIDFLWKSKTKQRMVCRMIHIKDSLLPMGKVWSLDSLFFLGGFVF